MIALDNKTKHVGTYCADGKFYLVGALFHTEITRMEYDEFEKLRKISQSRISSAGEFAKSAAANI